MEAVQSQKSGINCADRRHRNRGGQRGHGPHTFEKLDFGPHILM